VIPAKRRKLPLIAGCVLILAVLAYGLHWLLVARFYETTDDAYVAGDIVRITTAVPGIVTRIAVDDTEQVAAGALLLELDPADAGLRRELAEAELARSVRAVRQHFAQASAARAQLRRLRIELQREQQDIERRRDLVAQGAIGAEELLHAQDAARETSSRIEAAQADVLAADAPVSATTVRNNPEVLAAAARLRDAWLSLQRTRLTSTVAGVIAQRNVQVGSQVAAGATLMSVVPLDAVWVDANFRETQLAKLRTGQRVTLQADLYGGSVRYRGRIAGVAAGSGSAFSLIPPQNASGNWIKIVQRIPVRVLIDPEDLQAHPLRQGLSMSVRVDLRSQAADPLNRAVRNAPQAVRASDAVDTAAAARVEAIIAANSQGR
jgi:membrane fusion protein (multidrug efflux system)